MGRKKLSDKKIIHGALPEPKCIDDIIGRNWFPYKEKTEAEYQSNLEKMNFSDLQRHAIEIGNIIPNTDRKILLIEKLVRIYLKKKYQFVGQEMRQKVEEAPQKILDILKKGK